MADNHALEREAARLAKNNPQDWSRFIGALADHTDVIRNNCVTSPITTLPVNQGKAQALTDLLERLKKCVETTDRAIQRQEHRL